MDDPNISEEVKNNTEFIIDLTKTPQQIVTKIKANKTRAEEQKKVYDNMVKEEKVNNSYKTRIDKNMLFIYIDNISRVHFMRKLPKTAEWLAKFVEDDKSDYQLYQYFRYHGVYFNTQFSNSAMYYGAVHEVTNTSTNVFDSFAKRGYITGSFKDTCESRA